MSSDQLDVQKTIGYQADPVSNSLTEKQAILYALSIGYSTDPLNEVDFQYTYEFNEDFKIFPTVATSLHMLDLLKCLTTCPGLPNFNPMMLLHGEQRNTFYAPFKHNANYQHNGKISNVQDKGKGAIVTFEIMTHLVEDGQKTLICSNEISLFIRGLGGFGFKGNPVEPLPQKPTGEPTKIFEQTTLPNQAFLFRLNGDYNPLHIDPNMAAMGGFDKPILHGLCTYGIVTKAVTQSFCDGNGNNIKKIAARFTSHVFPGETIQVLMWKNANRVVFAAKTKERGLDVLLGAIDIIDSAKL